MNTKLLTLTTVLLVGTAFALPAAAKTSSKDFVKNASIGSEFEIESSQVALQKSTNAEVKSFAQRMIDDHGKAGEELKATVAKTKVDPSEIKTTLDAKHQKALDKVKNAPAASFDNTYLAAQEDAHKEAITLFKGYSQSGSNKDLKAFAKTVLPTIEEHKKMLDSMEKPKS